MKHISRAKRLDLALDPIESAKNEAIIALDELIEAAEEAENKGKELTAAETKAAEEEVREIVDKFTSEVQAAVSGVEELYDEIDSWASNMESANMEHLPKYEEVTECRDALDQLKTDLEDVSIDDTDAEAAKADIESFSYDSGSVNFPGMF